MPMLISTIRILFAVTIVAVFGAANSFAQNCDCSDWINRGGYCVDYIKEKIPDFPIPQNTAEIVSLKNKPVTEIKEGDVAIFHLRNYWHVAYVENVHRDQKGDALSIDVSEMNYGDRITRNEFKAKWKSVNEREWQRAICCGVTDQYDELSSRKNVAVNLVTQVWSPDPDDSQSGNFWKDIGLMDKAKDVFNRFSALIDQVL